MSEIQKLGLLWTEHYSQILPRLARTRHPAQAQWPVTLDHCFARIILDNTIGEGIEQWDKRLKRPAVHHMSCVQLEKAIGLARRIEDGQEDLVALDLQSLEARGKVSRKLNKARTAIKANDFDKGMPIVPSERDSDNVTLKRIRSSPSSRDEEALSLKKARLSGNQSRLNFVSKSGLDKEVPSTPASDAEEIDLTSTLNKIKADSSLTSYRKRLYAALLSVPRGRYTTYAALSKFLGSSARAVGNSMRNNPFAPDVPCHRVLASDGSIGGFGGSWGVDGENASKKFKLLMQEGVAFDSRRIVKGLVFREFVQLLDDE